MIKQYSTHLRVFAAMLFLAVIDIACFFTTFDSLLAVDDEIVDLTLKKQSSLAWFALPAVDLSFVMPFITLYSLKLF